MVSIGSSAYAALVVIPRPLQADADMLDGAGEIGTALNALALGNSVFRTTVTAAFTLPAT